jgi:glycosyltransferase involved in cell wall biosynthesis
MKSKISVIYNGVDLELFTPGIRQCGRTPRLLAIGRVIERKNPIAVINALTHFRERHGHHPSVTWVGEIQDRRYYERCRRLLQDCDLMDSWRWLGERHDVQQLYKQHDALIHPSLLEGVPNAVCEAMASGLPVLVGRIGDHERFVSDYENGFLFDPTSVQSILSALEKFCTSSAKQCFLMGSRSRLLAKKVFCPDRFVDAYETLFQRLIVKSFGGCTEPGSST